MDFDQRRAFVRGEEVHLRRKEFELLRLLIENSGRVLTRDVLIDRVWGTDYIGDTKTLDVHIKRLRSRIEADPSVPVLITTVRGVGYRFAALTAEQPDRPGSRKSACSTRCAAYTFRAHGLDVLSAWHPRHAGDDRRMVSWPGSLDELPDVVIVLDAVGQVLVGQLACRAVLRAHAGRVRRALRRSSSSIPTTSSSSCARSSASSPRRSGPPWRCGSRHRRDGG